MSKGLVCPGGRELRSKTEGCQSRERVRVGRGSEPGEGQSREKVRAGRGSEPRGECQSRRGRSEPGGKVRAGGEVRAGGKVKAEGGSESEEKEQAVWEAFSGKKFTASGSKIFFFAFRRFEAF